MEVSSLASAASAPVQSARQQAPVESPRATAPAPEAPQPQPAPERTVPVADSGRGQTVDIQA